MMRLHVIAGLLLLTAGAAPAQTDTATGFRGLFIHDQCIGENTEQPDTCLHDRLHEKSFTFGGRRGTVQDVTLRVRGLLEPTRVEGGVVPDPAAPWFVIGGEGRSPDYSQWQIEVSAPKATYTLNNYPRTSHTIYKEDFQVTIPMRAPLLRCAPSTPMTGRSTMAPRASLTASKCWKA